MRRTGSSSTACELEEETAVEMENKQDNRCLFKTKDSTKYIDTLKHKTQNKV